MRAGAHRVRAPRTPMTLDYERRTPLALDLRPRASTRALTIVFGLFAAAVAALRYWAPRLLHGSFGDRAEGAYLLLLFLALAYFAVLLPTGPYRLRFYEQGVWHLSWRGPRFVRWDRVRRASFDVHKGHVSINLWYGRLSFVRVPLDDYRKPATLYAEITRRLPVAPDQGSHFASRLSDAV
jgi:hypothetical protein